MSDEFARWNDLARLWHAQRATTSAADVARHARLERRRMRRLASAEAAGLAIAFIAANWIAMQTAFVAMSAISLVCFAVCCFVHHRLRREPPPSGGTDLLSSLEIAAARETWNLAQLRIGRTVTALTLVALGLLALDHWRHASTPPARLWSLVGGLLIVTLMLVWNLGLTRAARHRKARIDSFVAMMRDEA